MTRPELFLDLDGVLADFNRGVIAVTGKRPDQLPIKVLWRELSRHQNFFDTLEFMPDAPDLWAFCKAYEPTILTGLPMGTWAPEQKRRWVARMLGGHVKIITCLARDKHLYAGPGAILVDDREKARAAWEAAEGIFILHKDATGTIAALKNFGF